MNSTQQTDTAQNSTQYDAQNSAQYGDEQTQDALLEVLTDERYASQTTTESWERIEKPEPEPDPNKETDLQWLEDFFDFLFGNLDGSGEWTAYLPAMLKGLLILALLAFVVWVVRRAQKYGWSTAFTAIRRPKNRVQTHTDQTLSQSWEQLPNHEHIGQLVLDMLQDIDKDIEQMAGKTFDQASVQTSTNEISDIEHRLEQRLEACASLLYRGSLRWLHQQKLAYIAPATTEAQCLDQLEQLASLHEAGTMHTPNSQNDNNMAQITRFVSQIIDNWRVLAYASISGSSGLPQALLKQYQEQHQQLQTLANRWLEALPSHLPVMNAKLNNQANHKPNNEPSNKTSNEV